MDPGFEIGDAQNARVYKHAKVFFQCHTHFQVHNQVSWNCDTIITIGINKHEVTVTILRLCGHCCNNKAF